MCQNATPGPKWVTGRTWALGFLLTFPMYAQQAPEWRQIGNTAIEMALPSVASGPVRGAWFSPEGNKLSVETSNGAVFDTPDFENWRPATLAPVPVGENAGPRTLPEAGARWKPAAFQTGRYYAAGRFVYRSDDGGLNWTNLTAYRGESILGDGLAGLTTSPGDANDVVVFGRYGVWRSLDAGVTWTGLNQSLPNLPARRLLALPNGTKGARLWMDGGLGSGLEVEWMPGEKGAWRPVRAEDSLHERENILKMILGQRLGAEITAVAVAGDWIYAGSASGKIWVSRDNGSNWLDTGNTREQPRVEGFYVDPKEPRIALVVLGAKNDGKPYLHVARTVTGGSFWDNLTNNLPETAVHAVTADRSSGAIYIATDSGAYYMQGDLNSLSNNGSWMPISQNLPSAPAYDVRLDEAGNQIFLVLDGYGVFAASAPHRARQIRVVNAADFSVRPAAPGSVLSVLGAKLDAVHVGDLTAPILAATPTETQIQVPFEVTGASLTLSMQAAGGNMSLAVPLESVSPAIFIERDGTPVMLDADSGLLLSAMTPARSGGRIQVLATGLGKVQPAWPTGLKAPIENAPKVVAPVRVYVDRQPVEVTRATLAPGYIGFYVIEINLPAIVNEGPAELYIDADGRESNRVQLYLAR